MSNLKSKIKLSTIILAIGLVILAVGAGLSIAKIEPWADYVLILGAVIVIARGFVRTHEKDDNDQSPMTNDQL